MADLETPAAAVGVTRRFAEPDLFASALLGGEFDYLPAGKERFAATLRVLRVGDVVVQQADTSGHIARGGISPGMAVLLMNLRAVPRAAMVNGSEIGAAEAVLAVGGAEIIGHNPRHLSWGALAVPLPVLDELAELAPPQVRVHGAASLLSLSPDRAERLIGVMLAAGRLAENMPASVGSADCAQGLAMALREEVAAALTAEADARPFPRAFGHALRLVAAAEAFMEARVSVPVYTEQLCAALGVSARRLHDAFRATLGTSPHAYLKLRRLMLARRALQGRRGGPGLVKSVALDHGFWHFGHFARDYRVLFGESPSETLGTA